MSNTNFLRASEVLLLTGSDKREETIERYILNILFTLNGCETAKSIIDYTKFHYNLTLNYEEVEKGLQALKSQKSITYTGNCWELNPSAKAEIEDNLIQENKRINLRIQDFKSTLKLVYYKDEFEEIEVAKLYESYNDYIVECVFNFGRLATITFDSNSDSEAKVADTNSAYAASIKKIKSAKLKKAFHALLENIPDCLTSREVDYIDLLSSRSENFFSLGLSKEMARSLFGLDPIQWTIFLDTNILYSLLRIRDHAENSSVTKIIELFNNPDLHFNVTLRYLPETYNELKKAKAELESRIKPNKLSINQIKAAIASKQIDDFAKAYYKNILQFGDSTQHPSSIIQQAINVLKSKSIEIFRNSRKLDINSEKYLDSISAYNTYHKIKNEVRSKKRLNRKEKFIGQIEHDIFLRETIDDLRSKQKSQITHFQDCKVFALTLDKNLIHFDRFYSLRQNKNISLYVPKFFLPSILLKRLYKFLPVQSDDYKKAFVASITQPVFVSSDDKQKSIKTQNALAKFYALGIDDPKFIFKMITNDLLLDKLDAISDEQEIEDFVEGELSKQLKQTNVAIKSLTKELTNTKVALNEKNEQFDNSITDLGSLAEKVRLIEADKMLLMTELQKVRSKSVTQTENTNQKTQIPIPFDQVAADKRIEKATKIAKELNAEKRREYLNEQYQKWKWNPVYLLILLLILGVIVLLSILAYHEWDGDIAYAYYADLYNKHPSWKVLTYLSLGFIAIIDLFIFREIHKRWLDFKHIEAFKESVNIPKELREDFIEEQLK